LSGSPFSAPAPPLVRPSCVLDGLTWRMPASFVIGIEIAEAPELNSPRYAIDESSCAALRAFADVWPASHLPAAAVASSSDTYLIVKSPALLPFS